MFPAEFDIETYRKQHQDLRSFSDADLLIHYSQYGEQEGRIASVINTRETFLGLLNSRDSFLEIGAFAKPSLEFLRERGKLVHYADWLTKEELMQRASLTPDHDAANVPEIRWVLSHGYEQIDTTYDAVVSHHCVEHQPDLIRHFISVRSILNKNGWYLFSMPDKRRCFDHFIPETNLADIVDAYLTERKSPSFKSALEHICFTSQTFQDGKNPYQSRDPNMVARFNHALQEYRSTDYLDVHCWQFTPHSFRQLYNQLVSIQLLPPYQDFKVYNGGGEFYVAIEF